MVNDESSSPVNILSWGEAHIQAQQMVDKMDRCEKYWLMQGVGWHNGPQPGFYIGNIPGNPRLGIPSLNMNDAAGGFSTTQFGALIGTVTCWPSLLAMAAAWDPKLVRQFAVALGQEFSGKGANAILGPSVNVHRIARGGRNFEYLSGEDPFLGARLTSAYVDGVQSQGVFAVVKHFVLNNQETNRDSESSNVDEKTLWELYYPPFHAAVKAGVSAVMCGYNKVSGSFDCSNRKTLHDLKNTMGFQGFVQSDWGAAHATTVPEGLDQEMPGAPDNHWLSPNELVQVNSSAIDESAKRILAVMYRMQLFNSTKCTPPLCTNYLQRNVTKPSHVALAREAAAESIVLLQNEDLLLPLTREKALTLAVVGSAATAQPYNSDPKDGGQWNRGDYYSGGGSGHVTAGYVVTPLDGIRARASAKGIQVSNSTDSDDLDKAVEVAKAAAVTIVVAATTTGEASDRSSLELDNNADALIQAVAKVSKNVIVLLQIPGAVLMPWRNLGSVKAIAALFLGGQETGNAWADVLFGDRSPAGRLPIMMPDTEEDTIQPSQNQTIAYSEGMATSYRNKNFKSAFPFGHGLTYTDFYYSNPVVASCSTPDSFSICVTVFLTNQGSVPAKAVPQLYLEFPDYAGYPSMILKGFEKTGIISSGQYAPVTFILTDSELSYYDPLKRTWVRAESWTAHIGESSADIRQRIVLNLDELDNRAAIV